jgi:ATP-binding cassette subfamily C protein CydC
MRDLVSPLLRVLSLWRGRVLWLVAGGLITLASLAAGMALVGLSGGLVAGLVTGMALSVPALLRTVGPLRVVLRYLERLVAHDATFRALADLRVWFFRGLAGSAAGGLGFRRAGDVLARLVNDVEALDGLYIRILLPLCGAVLVVVVLAVFFVRLNPWVAAGVAVLFAAAAFALPVLAARKAAGAGQRLTVATAALRVAALDAISGPRGACWRWCRRARARCWTRRATPPRGGRGPARLPSCAARPPSCWCWPRRRCTGWRIRRRRSPAPSWWWPGSRRWPG